MSENTLLKNYYSPEFFEKFSEVLDLSIENFNSKKFKQLLFDEQWNNKELKERMRHTTKVLNHFLPQDFEKAAKILHQITSDLLSPKYKLNALVLMFIPDYIEIYGINHFKTSIGLFEKVTQLSSCEFAVRPFIIKYEQKMMEVMYNWSKHKNEHVRRLASEGCRPRLPWAMALPKLKQNPKPILPILEDLKQDKSEYVRRSVANNINDMTKDNQELVIDLVKKWKGISADTDAIIKHGCRTLLKSGNKEILSYFNLADSKHFKTSNFVLEHNKIKVGDDLFFSFDLTNCSVKSEIVRLEYAIYYLKLNGSLNKKVYKISEKTLEKKETIKISKRQSFRIITTRQFHKGMHQLAVIVNGVEKNKVEFLLS